MRFLPLLLLTSSLISGTVFAQENNVTRLRIFETKDVSYGSGRFEQPNCDNEDHCRFIELELKNNYYLTVKNCSANEVAFVNRVAESHIDRTSSKNLKKSCEEIISQHKLSPELLAKFQNQIGKKSRSALQIAKHSGKFAFFAIPTITMGFLTIISAPTPASVLFGSVTGAGGTFAYLTGKDAKKEIMGQATLVERYGYEVKPGEALKRYSVVYVLPTNWIARANNQAIGTENRKLYSKTFDNYVEGWRQFADYLARR